MEPEVIALVSAVLVASLGVGFHCAGMCGPFLLFAVGSLDGTKEKNPFLRHIAYHGGRLVTYSILGAIAGQLGQAMDFGAGMFGVQRVAITITGVLMIAFGLIAVLRILGVRIGKMKPPKLLTKLFEWGHAKAFKLPPFRRALVIGLLTVLLPCGPLYAFAIMAAGTSSPVLGALTMAVFCIGTMPVMITLGAGIHALSGPLAKYVPIITALAVVGVGVWMLTGRLAAPAINNESMGLTVPASLEETIEGVKKTDEEQVPCPLCDPDSFDKKEDEPEG